MDNVNAPPSPAGSDLLNFANHIDDWDDAYLNGSSSPYRQVHDDQDLDDINPAIDDRDFQRFFSPPPRYNDPSTSRNRPPLPDHDSFQDSGVFLPNSLQDSNLVEGVEDDEHTFDDVNFTPPPPSNTRTLQPSTSTAIDLTASSPSTLPTASISILPTTSASTSSATMAPPTKKRKRTTSIDLASTTAVVSTTNRKSTTPSAKRDSVEVVDLEDIEEKEEYETFAARQQAEAIKRQNEEEANKPVRLAEFQCIICMDQPTDLTVTHCGMSLLPPSTFRQTWRLSCMRRWAGNIYGVHQC